MSLPLSNFTRPFRIILIVFISLNLLFIFINSALPIEKSLAESEAVKDAVIDVLPEHTAVVSFVSDNIRSIAHFAEYALLGFLCTLYSMLYIKRTPVTVSYLVVAGLIIGFLDETVQIFSGRGSSIKDVWLDFSGYLTALLLTLSAFLLRKYIIDRIKDNNNG